MPPLRIGVDARELLGDATGVGRYLGELLNRWLARSDAARRRFVLYAPEPLRMALSGADVRVIGRGRGTWWEQTHLRRAVAADRPDVFFAPAYTAPIGLGVPLAVTIHDISFVAHPEWFRAREGLRRRWLTYRAATTASVVFTDSEFSRSEIVRHFNLQRSRIEVVPPGITPPSSGSTERPREPLVLFVGSLFNRRHLPDLIAAFARATKDLPAARLVIVGGDRTWPRQDLFGYAIERGIGARTEILDYVSGETLSDLYSRASVFAFLSEYEGFGMTPLEALAAGVPPVVLDTPVAREVYGAAAVYVPPNDLAETASALRRLLVEPGAAVAILAAAPPVLRRYSWASAAERTLEGIERVAAQ